MGAAESLPFETIEISYPNEANNVYLSGSFNSWTKIPMIKEKSAFRKSLNLNHGIHQFRFCVDSEWKTSKSLPTIEDQDGNLVNYIEIMPKPVFSRSKSVYSTQIPIIKNKIPPFLPCHLTKIPQNEEEVPHHVTINHLYASNVEKNVIMSSVTCRYRAKFVTTVYCRLNFL